MNTYTHTSIYAQMHTGQEDGSYEYVFIHISPHIHMSNKYT